MADYISIDFMSNNISLLSNYLKIHNVCMSYIITLNNQTNSSLPFCMNKSLLCTKMHSSSDSTVYEMPIIFRKSLSNLELPEGFYNCRHILGNVLVNPNFKVVHVFKTQTNSPRE